MASIYTPHAAYSGPQLLVSAMDAPDVAVDVFGLDEIEISRGSDLYPEELAGTAPPLTFTLAADMTTWTEVAPTLRPGLYRWTYVSGAINPYRQDVRPPVAWNEGWLGDYGTLTQRPWLRSGKNNEEQFWFPAPAFTRPGYESAAFASLFSANTYLDFLHPGGAVEMAYDGDPSIGPAEGSIIFQLERRPIPYGDGYWDVVWSSVPNKPAVHADDLQARSPRLVGLVPGLHLVRFYFVNAAREYRWQNFYIWVWKAQPRREAAAKVVFSPLSQDRLRQVQYGTGLPLPWELDPVRPAKQVEQLPKQRLYLEQQRKSAGNRTEVPETGGNLDAELKERGDGEQY